MDVQGAAEAAVGRRFLKLGAGDAAARGIAFLATIYLARLLGPDAYGVIVLATAIMLYVTCVSDCGIELLGVHDVARDPARAAGLIPAYLGARLIVAGVLIGLLVLAGLLVFPRPEGPVLAVYALLLFPVALGTRWVQLGLERGGSAALARLLTEGLAALLIVLLIRGPDDLLRAPLAQLAGEFAGMLLLIRWLPGGARTLRPRLQVEVLGTLFRRGWPLVLHTLLGLLIFNSDFFFLRLYRDSATVGLYAVAYTLVSFLLNLGSSYELSLLPSITRLGAERETRQALYGNAMAQVFAGAFPIAVGGSLIATPLLTAVFGSEYAEAGAPLGILIWCVPVAVFRNVAQTALIAGGRQASMLRTVAWAALASAVLNATLIPSLGMLGAASITVGTEALRTGLALRFARGTGVSVPSAARFWRVLLAGAVMAAALALARVQSVWLALAVGVLVYGLALLALGGIKLQRGALPELTV